MSEAMELPHSPPGLELHHLSPVIGTEVLGIDLRETLSDAVISWLSDLLVERKVLFFREQAISAQQHIAFARRFGELEIHPFTTNDSAHAEIIHLNNDRENPPRINIWHSDVTWREAPSLGSILRAVEVPAVGGDTLFANMEAAYARLDDDTKAMLADLQAIHDNSAFLNGMRARGASEAEIEAKRQAYPPTTHPVVRTHPVSGKPSIYVNRAFTQAIAGWPEDESRRLLQSLYQTASNPDVQCRFRWRPDSLAFWDNRATQHFAAADYWPHTRRMQRVTIIGDRPH